MITVLVQHITDEMEEWFLEQFNMDNTKFLTQQHTCRIMSLNGYQNQHIIAGPHPKGRDFCYYGYDVIFFHEEDAIQFRLTFAEDIEKFNPTLYANPW